MRTTIRLAVAVWVLGCLSPARAQQNQAEVDSAVAFALGNWAECLELTTKLLDPSTGGGESRIRAAAICRAAACRAILGETDPAVKSWRQAVLARDLTAVLYTDRLAPVLAGKWEDVPKLLDVAGANYYGSWESFSAALDDSVKRLETIKGAPAEPAAAAAATMREAVLYLNALALARGWYPSSEKPRAALAAIVAAPAEQRERAASIFRAASRALRAPVDGGAMPGYSSSYGGNNVVVQLLDSGTGLDTPTATFLLSLTDDPSILRAAMQRSGYGGRKDFFTLAFQRLLALSAADPTFLARYTSSGGELSFGEAATQALPLLREVETKIAYPARREVRRLLFGALRAVQYRGDGQALAAEEAARTAILAQTPANFEATLALADYYGYMTWQPAVRGGPGQPVFPPAVETQRKQACVLYGQVVDEAEDPAIRAAAWTGLAEADAVAAWEKAGAMKAALADPQNPLPARRLLAACGLAAGQWAGVKEHVETLAAAEPGQRLTTVLAAAVRVLNGDPPGALALLDKRPDRNECLGAMLALGNSLRLALPGVPLNLLNQASSVFMAGDSALPAAQFALEQAVQAANQAPDAPALGRLCLQALAAGATAEGVTALRGKFVDACIAWLRARPEAPEAPLELLQLWCGSSGRASLLSAPDVHRLTLACLQLANERKLPEDRTRVLLAGYPMALEQMRVKPEQRAALVLEARGQYP